MKRLFMLREGERETEGERKACTGKEWKRKKKIKREIFANLNHQKHVNI